VSGLGSSAQHVVRVARRVEGLDPYFNLLVRSLPARRHFLLSVIFKGLGFDT
jgi:hypothetical protein